MKKSKAVIILVVFLCLLLGITYVDFFGTDGMGTNSASDITLGLELAGGVSITYQVVGEEAPSATDMADTIGKLQQRVFAYNNEALVYQEGSDRINIEIPGVTDANAILQELGRPGTMYFIYQKGSDGSDNYTGSYSTLADGSSTMVYTLNKTIEELEQDGSIPLYGTDVKDAQAGSMQNSMGNTEFCVDLLMTEEGTKKFADATTRASKSGETLAIYYDGSFLSVPTVSQALTDGRAQISGNFTYDSADKLASRIRIGGLKLELKELHSKVVGAQLGSAAVSTSLKAGIIGISVIVVLMIAIYYLSGLAASLALLMYTALVVLLLNGFDITLTLPGIAGIILSIGMAVDANVIIFARIREEIAGNRSVNAAIQTGFSKALSAIVDGNVTTLIAAAVLWALGSGSIRGFAQTLVLGIVLSMFTALVVTKLLMRAFYALGFTSEKWYGKPKPVKTIHFVERKKLFFAISLILIVGGFVMMFVNQGAIGHPLNFSLDFVGGTSINATFQEEKSLAELEKEIVPVLEKTIGSSVQPQPVAGTKEVVFKSNALNVDQRKQVEEVLKETFQVEPESLTMETISPTISDEMKGDTILAVVIAIIGMLVYIRIRFKDIRFGASGVLALVHDVLVVLAFYAAARISVGSTFIACMLTIVGYSINATIVIFDRIRENRIQKGKTGRVEMIDLSITQTLSRSIFTSLTTLIMVAALYILGVTAIREFALPLMVGIACGAYSSICLAGSLYFIMHKKKEA